MPDVTQILSAIEQGDPSAAEQLLPLVYDELRKLAAARLAQEKPGQTLQATALVHEAYLRLVDVDKAQHWNSRGHFFAAAAEAMRRILIEIARRKGGPEAGGRHVRVELPDVPAELHRHPCPVVAVATKCDLRPAMPRWAATSAVTGEGLEALRADLADRARGRKQPALAPSLSRCRHHVEACLKHLRLAHAVVLYEDPPEILALELRGAITQLGEMVGAVYTEDLLDRIFSRFCIGK